MNDLILYRQDHALFESDELGRYLETLPQISGVRYSPVVIAAVEGCYSSASGSAVIRLISSRRALSIVGDPPAVAEAILLLKSVYPDSLRVIDESYGFDISLNGIQSFTDLKRAIERAEQNSSDGQKNEPA